MPERKGTTGVVAYIALLMVTAASFGNDGTTAGYSWNSTAFSASAINWANTTTEPFPPYGHFQIEISGRTYEAEILREVGPGSLRY